MKSLLYLLLLPILVLLFAAAKRFSFTKRHLEHIRYDVSDLLTEDSET